MALSRILECAIPMKRTTNKSTSPCYGLASLPAGRVPRIARLLALAHKFDGLVRQGTVPDYAALARLGHVSRARLSQIKIGRAHV